MKFGGVFILYSVRWIGDYIYKKKKKKKKDE